MEQIRLLIGVMVAVVVYTSAQKGATRELSWIVGSVLGLLGIPVLYTPIRNVVEALIPTSQLSVGIPSQLGSSFSGTYTDLILKMIVFSVIFFFGKHAGTFFFDASHLSATGMAVDKVGGALLGVLKVFLLMWVINLLVEASSNPFSDTLGDWLMASSYYNFASQHNLLRNVILM